MLENYFEIIHGGIILNEFLKNFNGIFVKILRTPDSNL